MAWDVTVKHNATIEDTLTLIVQAVNVCSAQPYAQLVAEKLDPSHAKDLPFLQRLFNFVKESVQYVNDKDGIERVFTPDLTIREAKGDCKKMTVLIASVLKAAGIEPILKHVVYGPEEKWTHIYTIVSMVPGFPTQRNQYYVLDPTIPGGTFNQEVAYRSGLMMDLHGNKSKDMDLHMMGKIPGSYDKPMTNDGGIPFSKEIGTVSESLIGASESLVGAGIAQIVARMHPDAAKHMKPGVTIHQAITKGLFPKGNIPKYSHTLEAVPIENQRGALLQLIKQNVDGIASHLLAVLGTEPTALDNVWKITGGDINALKQEIIKAAKLPVTNSGEVAAMKGDTLVGGGFFRRLLHAASNILHAIAPIANAIIPGSGAAIMSIANKADQISANLPVKANVPGGIAPPPGLAIPPDPHGLRVHGGAMSGIVYGKPWHSAFKCFIYAGLIDCGIHIKFSIIHNSTADIASGLCLISAVVISALISKYGISGTR